MKIAVTDANIFIDIIYLKIHPILFKIGLEIYTTQYVLDELDEEQLEELRQIINDKILMVYSFSNDELNELSKYFVKRSLSAADHSVLFIANKMKAMVISGDALVRKTCNDMKLEVHGILWLMDECINCNHFSYKQAHNKLSDLMIFNKRLPIKECETRLAKWEEGF